MGHILTNSGFFDLSHCRLLPLQYRLPARFDTIPSSQLARLGEHDRAIGLDRLAEHDVAGAGDEPRELVAPLLERALAEILAVEAEEVEGDEAGLGAAGLGAQRPEIAASVRSKRDRLAVDQRVFGGQFADRPRDRPFAIARPVADASNDDSTMPLYHI